MKITACRSLAASTVLVFALMMPMVASAAGKPKPTMSVIPKKVAVLGSARVDGFHLRPNTYMTFLLAIPDIKHFRFERFVNLSRTDARGHVEMFFKVPLEQYCGKASIYAYNRQKQKLVRAVFTITGCRAHGTPGALPPLPKPTPKKKGHKP